MSVVGEIETLIDAVLPRAPDPIFRKIEISSVIARTLGFEITPSSVAAVTDTLDIIGYPKNDAELGLATDGVKVFLYECREWLDAQSTQAKA